MSTFCWMEFVGISIDANWSIWFECQWQENQRCKKANARGWKDSDDRAERTIQFIWDLGLVTNRMVIPLWQITKRITWPFNSRILTKKTPVQRHWHELFRTYQSFNNSLWFSIIKFSLSAHSWNEIIYANMILNLNLTWIDLFIFGIPFLDVAEMQQNAQK